MLCCLPPSWVDAKAAYNEQAYSNEVTEYPGNRRNYVKTAGNALAEAPSPLSTHYPSSPQQPAYNDNKQADESISGMFGENDKREILTALQQVQTHFTLSISWFPFLVVTVPNGVVGGQIIHVSHPDESGRLVRCEVPKGLNPGSTFYVKAPVMSPVVVAPSASSPAVTATPIPPPTVSFSPPYSQRQSPIPSAPAYPISGNHVDLTTIPSPTASPTPFSECLDDEYPSRYTPGMRPSPMATPVNNDDSELRLVKVVVPPGTQPGTTIHVQIPGENRLVAAQVPPNCTEFHVQYDPLDASTPCSSAILNSPAVYHHHNQRQRQQQYNQYNQYQSQAPPRYAPAIGEHQQGEKKLLLVHVPRGMAPGSTLHVEVPNEPGRLLSVQVPPNVRQFHVSYLPQSSSSTSHQFHHHQQQRQQRDDSDWGSSVLPIAGTVATGLAGAMIYDHFAHP